MILGTKARYAVMAMVEMAQREAGRPVSLADLSKCQEITVPYLEQIFRSLRFAGLVKSVRGPGGGYVLERPPENINIAEIVAAVNESLQMTRCEPHKGTGCMTNKSRCLTHDLWDGLTRQIHGYLSSITLADICNQKKHS